jgi:hypothetical protein
MMLGSPASTHYSLLTNPCLSRNLRPSPINRGICGAASPQAFRFEQFAAKVRISFFCQQELRAKASPTFVAQNQQVRSCPLEP